MVAGKKTNLVIVLAQKIFGRTSIGFQAVVVKGTGLIMEFVQILEKEWRFIVKWESGHMTNIVMGEKLDPNKISTPKSRYSVSRNSEFRDIVNKSQLPSFFTSYIVLL